MISVAMVHDERRVHVSLLANAQHDAVASENLEAFRGNGEVVSTTRQTADQIIAIICCWMSASFDLSVLFSSGWGEVIGEIAPH
jgi:hypothetical protein